MRTSGLLTYQGRTQKSSFILSVKVLSRYNSRTDRDEAPKLFGVFLTPKTESACLVRGMPVSDIGVEEKHRARSWAVTVNS